MYIIVGWNGSITFTGVAPGKYRLRVVASTTGNNQSVIRRIVVIPRPSYCTVNLIIEGVIISKINMTAHFWGVGCVKEFLYAIDQQTKISCQFVAPCMCAQTLVVFKKKFSSAGGINNLPIYVCDLPVQSVHVISFHYKAPVYRRDWLIGECAYRLQQQENMRLLYVCAY